MKIGYSMLLGEYIDAELINYKDCKNFQIVCPVCREPIFKVERKHTPPTIHYLSHYEESKAFLSDCELRVKGISNKDKNEAKGESRYQRLKYFLSILRDEILKNEFKNSDRSSRGLERLIKSSGFKAYRDLVYDFMRSSPEWANMTTIENMSILFDEYIEDIKSAGGEFPDTGFAVATQKRIARDIFLHLLSAHAAKNFTFLFCSGICVLSARIETASKQRPLCNHEERFLLFFHQLLDMGKPEIEDQFLLMAAKKIGPPYAISGSNYLNKLTADINHEKLGILLRLPYFEMLKRAKTFK